MIYNFNFIVLDFFLILHILCGFPAVTTSSRSGAYFRYWDEPVPMSLFEADF